MLYSARKERKDCGRRREVSEGVRVVVEVVLEEEDGCVYIWGMGCWFGMVG